MTKGQGPVQRAERLDRGACPVHGIELAIVSQWLRDANGEQVAIATCPRKDCDETYIVGDCPTGDMCLEVLATFTEDTRLFDETDYRRHLEQQVRDLKARLAKYEGGAS